MSYNINLQHIVFRTAHSEYTIPEASKTLILSYIYNISVELNVSLIRINAWRNHVHILVDFPVGLSLPEYVRKIKSSSSMKFKRHPDLPLFAGWATGYGSFSVSHYEKDRIINYIKNQEEHHRYKTFAEEIESFFGAEFVSRQPYWAKDWLE